ncbi:hypothetical protein FRC09_018050 [Ceratobasidium sp. 395]|nr:hypothetical protein FRC09_018050 [Ceratobasidium sp. 395]
MSESADIFESVHVSPAPTETLEPGEHMGIFVSRGPQTVQRGFPTGFAISPNGRLVFSATLDDLVLLDTRTGRTVLWIITGPLTEGLGEGNIGAIAWKTSKVCFLGCDHGLVYVANVGGNTLTTNPTLTISYLFRGPEGRIKALCWDAVGKFLALCYDECVSVWKITDKIEEVDEIPIARTPQSLSTLTWFGTSKRCLFIGGGFGYAVWHGYDDVTFFRDDGPVPGITSSAISSDGQYLAATTFTGVVNVWKVSDAGLEPDPSTRTITSGKPYRTLYPFTPVGFAADGLVAVGTQAGIVELSGVNGNSVNFFSQEVNWSVIGLLTHKDRVYVQYLGPVGAIIIVGYVSSFRGLNAFERHTESQQITGPPPEFRAMRIDISRIPKASLANPPMQTGGAGPSNAASTANATSDEPSKRIKLKVTDDSDLGGSLSSGCQFVVMLVSRTGSARSFDV